MDHGLLLVDAGQGKVVVRSVGGNFSVNTTPIVPGLVNDVYGHMGRGPMSWSYDASQTNGGAWVLTPQD